MNTSLFVVVIFVLLVVAYAMWSAPAVPRKRVASTAKCSASFRDDRLTPCEADDDCAACEDTMCVDVSREDHYRYGRAGETLDVPVGRWCLHPKITDMPCNDVTGFRVLTRNPTGKGYVWRCHCKNPKTVRNAGVYGDCEEVVACGRGELVCPPNSTHCRPGEKWKDTRDWDPDTGVCECPDGLKYVVHDGRKLCETDECYPGRASDEGCTCPAPVVVDGEYKSTVSVGNKCIPDPCNPSGFTQGGRCVCRPGSIPFQDELSPTGWVCKSPCDPKDNPCGNKGRCVFDKAGNVSCTDCRYPNYQSKDGMCNNLVKHGNVQCENEYECETRACDSFFAPLWKIGNGLKYCSPY